MRVKTKKRIARERLSKRQKEHANGNGNAAGILDAGARGTALDYFVNAMARMGWGTASLPEASDYEMVRLSNNYWLLLTLYRNSWLPRRIVDLPAQDMTRAWPKLQSDLEPDDISEFDRTVRRTYTPRDIRRGLKWGRLYGGAGALMAIKGHESILDKPLDLDDVNPGTYLGLIPFDRWVGIWPVGAEISEDMDRPLDWGLPEFYECQSQESGASNFRVHSSRIIRFTGPDVPTPEFQAQMYWGISVLELVYEEMRKKDNASWAMLNLLFRANIIARVDPKLDEFLGTVNVTAQQRLAQVLQAQNELLSSQSMMVLGKDGHLESTQYSFAGINDLYSQFQMDTAGAAEIPVTRLFGRTVTGLGQSNDADERYYEEMIAQKQDEELRPGLESKLYPVICMSEFGEVPDDLAITFPSIRVLTEEEKSELVQKASEPILAAANAGILGRKTVLKELRQLADTTGIFSNITDKNIEDAEEEPMLPGEGMAFGPGGEPLPGETGQIGVGKTPKALMKEESGESKTGDSITGRDMSPKYMSLNGSVGDRVQDLMERRSFDLEEEKAGYAVYSRHSGDIRLKVNFKDGNVQASTVAFSGHDRAKAKKAAVTREGWEGLQSFAGALGDAALEEIAPAGKYTHKEVSYEDPAKGADRCAGCKFFTRTGGPACKLVRDVTSTGWCRKYKARSAADARTLHNRFKWHGLDISIENEAGSVRRGVDKGGKPWQVKLTHDYGYIRRTEGVDGDHVDCFIGPDPESEQVFIIHTLKSPDFQEFDEDKCMLNFPSEADAQAAFFENYSNPSYFGSMETMPVGKFIDKVLETKGDPQPITH